MSENRYVLFKSQNKIADDCAIRAIMKLTGKTWVEIYDELCDIGRNKKRMPNEWKVIEIWLRNHGYVKYTYGKIIKGDIKWKVSEFAENNQEGKYILNLAHHVVACIDGYYYDSWDPGDYKVLTYYKYENE